MSKAAIKLAKSDSNLELGAIYEISKILSSSLDLRLTLREVLSVLSSHLKMRRGMASLVQDTGELHVVSASGLSEEEVERGRYRRGEGITGRIMKSGSPMVIPDVAKEPLFLNRTGSRRLVAGHSLWPPLRPHQQQHSHPLKRILLPPSPVHRIPSYFR